MDQEFEFDPAKSATNHDKHGIDFVEAQGLWTVFGIEKAVTRQTEQRFMRTGRLGERLWR